MKASTETDRSNVVAFARPVPTLSALEAEVARRIALLGYADWLRCARTTGVEIPAPVRFRKMQIEFVAEAMKRLDPLPDNFRADHFWPA